MCAAQSVLIMAMHSQAVFDSCRTLDLRNATVTLSCVDLLRDAKSLECLRLRSDYFTADKDCSKHDELQRFIALLPVSCTMPLSCLHTSLHMQPLACMTPVCTLARNIF